MEAEWLLHTIKVVSFFIGANPLPYLGMLFWFAFSIYYLRRAFANFSSINVILLQFIPFIFIVLGVLGTVAGSLSVAWNFDASSLTDAAKTIFKGILGAGSSTIVGLVFAMVFSKLVNMTQIKEEQQKALQNRELFVLKKILKLMKADYDRDAVHNAQYKDGLKSLQQGLGSIQQENQDQAASFIEALQRPGEQMAQEMATLRSELSMYFKNLIDAQNHQSKLLKQVLEALVSEEETAIPGRLQLMHEQNQLASQYLEQRLTGMQTAMQQQAKSSIAVLNQALENNGKELAESIKSANVILTDQNETLIRHLSSLDETTSETRKEMGTGLDALCKITGETLPAALDANNRQVLKQVSKRSDEVLARISKAEENTTADLGAMVFAAEEQTKTLQGLIEGASSQIAQSRGALMDKLKAVLLSHQTHAQDSSALITSLAGQLTEQFKATFSAAEEQQLRSVLSLVQERLSSYESVAANMGEEIRTSLERTTGQVQQVSKEQHAQLSGMSLQMQSISASAQETKEHLQALSGNTGQLVESNQSLHSLMKQIKHTETSLHSLDQVMEKIEHLSRQRENKPGSILGPVFAQQSEYAAIKDELSRSMNALLQRLREIEDIKKTDGRFWKQVERQIQDGIPIIMGGNKLELQNADLDAGFRDRLSQSFVNLDRMLETIVQGYKRRSNGNGNGNGNGTHARSNALLASEQQRIGLS